MGDRRRRVSEAGWAGGRLVGGSAMMGDRRRRVSEAGRGGGRLVGGSGTMGDRRRRVSEAEQGGGRLGAGVRVRRVPARTLAKKAAGRSASVKRGWHDS
jgi:general stress protein YciG